MTSPLLLVRARALSLSLSPSLAIEFCVFSSSPLLKLFGCSSCVSCGGYIIVVIFSPFFLFFSGLDLDNAFWWLVSRELLRHCGFASLSFATGGGEDAAAVVEEDIF